MTIDSRRGALKGPFVRWADTAERRGDIVVQAIRIPEAWVYMMEPDRGYVVKEQVHASEQVVQVVSGSLRLQVGGDEKGGEERLLTEHDVAVIPQGHYHRGLVTTPSRIFELNTPADNDNLFDPAKGAFSFTYPRKGAALQTDAGHVIGHFARWAKVAGNPVKQLWGDRVHVEHLTLAPGAGGSGVNTGTVVIQPLRGRITLKLDGVEQTIDSGWVAIGRAGGTWEASCPDGAELLEVRFLPQGPAANAERLVGTVRRLLGK